MNDIIKLLPESVANCIAAGEVVQRPSSVVKEMMENSIDAGAQTVRLILADAGRTSIQIIDDGCGMSPTDALASFQRHATSKIRTSDDLFSLTTFGFRGEALASIAAVSEVRLRTRRAEDEIGTEVVFIEGKFVSQEPVSCPAGCNFTVSDLFRNVPARRKFLKSNQTELGNIMKEVERVALSHPEMSVSVVHQNSELLSLQPSSLKQRIIGLFGKNMNKALYPVSVETEAVTVGGFVGSLDSVRKKGAEQFFFVNGRFMRHPYFHKAVVEPYADKVPQGELPSYFIFLTVPAGTVDVNIHPAKTEVKFSEEQLVWKILNAAVRETIGRYEAAPSIDFDTDDMPDIPVPVSELSQIRQPKIEVNPTFNPFRNSPKTGAATNGWTSLYDNVSTVAKAKECSFEYEPQEIVPPLAQKKDCPCFQFGGEYVATSSDNCLLVLNVRRMHICVLYEEFVSRYRHGVSASQGLVFPEIVQLSPSDSALLPEYVDELRALGFDLSDMGHGAVAIQGIPSEICNVDCREILTEMLHNAAEGTVSERDGKVEKMALVMAKSVAVTSGKTLSVDEMRTLISRFDECGMPRRTPDGDIVYVQLSEKELKSRF